MDLSPRYQDMYSFKKPLVLTVVGYKVEASSIQEMEAQVARHDILKELHYCNDCLGKIALENGTKCYVFHFQDL